MTQQTAASDLQQLQSRIQAAEVFARTALQGTEEENPLFHPIRKLLAVHEEIRDLLESAANGSDKAESQDECGVVHAAIEIEREEHTLKADAKDILKALFMWKDDPEKRAKQKSA